MEVDDDLWEVQNRKRRSSGTGGGSLSDVSKFFVTNIPQGCRPWDLANAFRPFGEIAGAFLAKKKDKEGRTFGFVSFRGVRDMEELKINLSKVKLGGNKLLVNVALFVKENGNLKPSGQFGGRAKGTGEGLPRPQGVFSKGFGAQHVKKGASFLDILTNRTYADNEEDVLVVDPGIFSLSNLSGKALGGRASGVYELRFVKSNMLLAGYAGAGIQYLGGLSVLISFDDGDLAKKLLSEKEVWSRWFVNILGVPPHLISRRVFDLIGSKYGKVVHSSQFLESDGDLSFDRLGILLDTGNRINGVLSLSWQDKRYKVWVVEENDQWIPDFLEDDEISVAASSELGGDSAIPVDDTPASKED
ncbi:putative RNA recognition motif domain, nucleotide-binding alpha-beta plait domain superfamily [Helianthus annuus]|nr:putative RNA recognition motif domain, nucleotide-binding alpha-beta plait domain superfamily [Helianthus annuus]KAJ0577793.1 putative RNA recognition motif domain, nucleotide-binding alpha-beta plait domain superfamily [Helianthus annuus]KAJ0747721.1 putative RNA recognition motif domain, nucleotide-binding alpha-beta plait domain superfamily [Helianthus annuus]KAJ0923397.1 putative RNA recognition motif domain, nucleotide-binding alpha-beta plait domain superfamily [Helianthus annuus]